MSYSAILVSILAGILGLMLYFSKQENSKLQADIAGLKDELLVLNQRLRACKDEIDTQNIAILKLKAAKPKPHDKKIEKIYIKDRGCKASLKAYKELLNASF